MSADDLAELTQLGVHLLTRYEESRGVEAIDATIVERIYQESYGPTFICALVTTKHPPTHDGQLVNQRAVLVSISSDRRAASFHVRAANLAEIICGLAKIAVLISKTNRVRRRNAKDSEPEPSG